MTTLHTGNTQLKSSVYNRTGENYFEQLSAYNRMNNHLRRILLAQSVVDSRNKKYMREKRLSSGLSNCSKSLDQILARRDIIDGIAYDTVYNPIDLLRMKLGCDPDCRLKSKKRILEERQRSCIVQCRNESPKVARRSELNSETICHSRTSKSRSPIKSGKHSCGSARSSILTGKRVPRQSEVDGTRRKSSNEAGHRISQNNRNDRVLEAIIDERYSYESSFESLSDNSSVDSRGAENCKSPSSSRPHGDTHSDQNNTEMNRTSDKLPEVAKRNEEAKYAKFLYDITQEIVLKGLYRDQELGEVFQKHIEANLQTLDRDKMLLEIDQLKASLNMEEFSGEKDNDYDVARSSHPERHGTFTRTKSPNNLNERKLTERLKSQEKTRQRSDDSSKRPSSRAPAKNAILLLDTSPEMSITEHEVLVTLMDMKFDPRQVRTICRSLRNNIEAMSLSHTDESNSRDQITHQVVEIDAVKKMGECQFREKKTTCGLSATERCSTNLPIRIAESQTNDEKSEVGIQTSRTVSQNTRGIATSISLERMAGLTRVETSPRCSEFGKISETIQTVTKDHRTQSTRSELPYFEKSHLRKSSSRKSEENERSDSTNNEEIKQTDRKKSSSLVEDPIMKNGRTDDNSSRPIMQLIEEFDDNIDAIHVTSERKNTEKPVDLGIDETVIDNQSTDDPNITKKLEHSEVNDSNEEVPITDILTEWGSLPTAPHDPEKRDKITDDELASLPEEFSQMEDSASMLDSENAEKSRVSSMTPSQPSKLQSIVSESSDDKKYSHPDDKSKHETKQIDLQLNEITPGDARNGNDSEEFHRNTPVVVESSRKNSKYDDERVKNDTDKKLTGSSVSPSPNHDDRRKTRGDDDNISAPERSPPRETHESENRQNATEKPPGPSKRSRNKRSTTANNIADKNNSLRRFRAKPSDPYTPTTCERNSCKRRKKNAPISSLCLGKLIASSDPESATILQIYGTPPGEEVERDKKPSDELSMTTESSILLSNKEDLKEPSIRFTDSASDNEDEIEGDASIAAEKETASWRETPRDTIHRRTSVLRSIRTTIESLKKRLSTSTIPSPKSSEISVPTAISTNMRMSRQPPEMLEERKEKQSKLTDWSDDTSSSSLEMMISLQVTIEQGRVSEISSIDASTLSASEIDRSNELSRVLATTDRCKPDCPGPQTFSDHRLYHCFCRSNFIEGQYSMGPPSGGLDSVENNDKNIN